MRYGNTIEAEADKNLRITRGARMNKNAYSFKSIISKPLAQRTTTLALRKIRSNASVGRKKSL